VVRFAKEQLEQRTLGKATQSLGVGTFNLRQQLAILDELEKRRRDDWSLEPFFARDGIEPFFVKNLENIQGDERDVIFISVTYARANDGKLRYTFGPLNGENGWRRLNVLTTRARQRMKVFSSMKGDEINAAATTSRGAHLLREFLLFAERGRLESVSASLAAETDSPFERDVLTELTNRGVTVVPQVGVAGYRIDLGVLDDAAPGRFLCGIECDGVAYHSSETARDRDRLRQQVLEARGWEIHRIWSTDWFKDRPGQIERLLTLIDSARTRAQQEVEAERQARAHATEEVRRRATEEAEAIRREAAGLAAHGTATVEYERPIAAAYIVTPGEGSRAGSELLDAPLSQLVQVVVAIVENESPIHETDLFSRIAAFWGTRAGSRIRARIREACSAANRSQVIQSRGEFYWNASGSCHVRTRAGTRIPAERVAPEEYQQAVLAVLGTGHGFSRSQLTTEVRAVFGFNRTGAALDEAIGEAIDLLLVQQKIGEASIGIRLRR
jgi:very-short-patch-repair endonuclease